VERYSLACQAFLLARDVKLVLIACNTASANALPALREASPVPVIGAVDPGAEAALAATRGGHVGVIGTLGTVRSGAYERALATRTDVRVTSLACPLFVPLAEEGWTDAGDEVARVVARRYLGELFTRDRAIDTLVLGCTHYPLLRAVITETAWEIAGHDVAVVDSATAMAEAAAAAAQLTAVPDGRKHAGKLDCYATDISRLDEIAPRFLGEPVTSFELVDL
jgi:glutamate racemase